MKPIFSLAALTAALVLAGCEHTPKHAQQVGPPFTPERQAAIEVHGPGQRAFFVAATYLDLLIKDQEIAALGDKVASLQTDEVAKATVNALHERRSELDVLFDKLASADEKSWGDARKAFESRLIDLDTAYQSAKATYDN